MPRVDNAEPGRVWCTLKLCLALLHSGLPSSSLFPPSPTAELKHLAAPEKCPLFQSLWSYIKSALMTFFITIFYLSSFYQRQTHYWEARGNNVVTEEDDHHIGKCVCVLNLLLQILLGLPRGKHGQWKSDIDLSLAYTQSPVLVEAKSCLFPSITTRGSSKLQVHDKSSWLSEHPQGRTLKKWYERAKCDHRQPKSS